jgi:glycosyltransferase involved in cell wall biosynthesis
LHSFGGGGAEQVFVRLANHFAASGLQPHFIVNIASGPVRKALSDAVPVHEFGVRSTLAAVPRLAALIRRERPDVLLSALVSPNIGAVVARALSLTRTPLIISERNHLSSLLRHRSKARRIAIRQLVRLAYPRADAIVAVAEGVAEDLSEVSGIGLDRIDVIHNPSPDASRIAAARTAPAPHPWLTDGQQTLIAIGRLTPQKGYFTLLAALSKVRRAKGDVRLIVLGDGPLLSALNKEVDRLGLRSAVHFAGFVENPFDYLVRCSLYVLTSDTEGFPNGLIEALACGAPAVSTDCAGGGPAAILRSSYAEALVPVGDVERLADAIIFELGRSRPSDRIEAIASRFSLESIANQFLAVFDAVGQCRAGA